METIHKLSLNNLKRVVGVSAKHNKKVQWRSSEITIKQLLSAQEYIAVTQDILRDCLAPDGTVAIELIDFAIRANIVAAYAYVELPTEFEELYYVLYASDLYDKVCSVANKAQITEIEKTIAIYVQTLQTESKVEEGANG